MQRKFDVKFFLAVVILILSNLLVYKSVFTSPIAPHALPGEFPSKILNWSAEEVRYDESVLSILAPDKIIYKTYHRKDSPPITLFMSYYNTLEKADLSHSPIVCFTGQGWAITKRVKHEILVDPSKTQRRKVNKLIQNKNDTTLITLFWYQSANRAFSNRGVQKISLLFDKLMGKSDRNAFVTVTVSVPPQLSVEKTNSQLDDFVHVLYPELRRFFL